MMYIRTIQFPNSGGKMKKKLFKFVVLCLSIWGLYNVATCSIVEYPSRNIAHIYNYTKPITDEDIKNFLPVWQEFSKKRAADEDLSAVSFSNKLPSEVLPFTAVLWLKHRGWEANRFFFVEQRLYDLAKTVYLKRYAGDIVYILTKSLETEKDEEMRENMQKIIDEQSAVLKMGEQNKEELQAVENNLQSIVDIMGAL